MSYCPRNWPAFLDCFSLLLDFRYRALLIIRLSSWHHIIGFTDFFLDQLVGLLTCYWSICYLPIPLPIHPSIHPSIAHPFIHLSISFGLHFPSSHLHSHFSLYHKQSYECVWWYPFVFLCSYICLHMLIYTSIIILDSLFCFFFLSWWPIVSKTYPGSCVNIQSFVSDGCRTVLAATVLSLPSSERPHDSLLPTQTTWR